mgnify:CR=1 FL=1
MLYENEEPDTSSYQMRMLVGNSIPSILKCRVQGVDGQFMVCYDITSKQSLLSLYEEKKMGYEDLQMILGGFVQVMEEMSEYLLNPCRLVLKPEYMYVDVEKRQIYFCYLPGYDEDVRRKLQELTEYILPILDHEDSKAVMLGYGIYRRFRKAERMGAADYGRPHQHRSHCSYSYHYRDRCKFWRVDQNVVYPFTAGGC